MQLVRELLRHPDVARHAYGGMTGQECAALTARDVKVYTGKVRDVVFLPPQGKADDQLLIVHSDRLSAFDRLIGTVPYKGTILTAISEFWLKEAQKVVPTHYLGRPHERVLRTVRAEPVKAEIIVRGYMAGSMQRAYEKGERTFCGAVLPEGLKAFRPLHKNIITPTTKAAAFEHDEDTTPDALVAAGVCTAQEWKRMEEMALTLFAHGQKVYREHGWHLVDTKYEIGRKRNGELIVIDEIHTPDSSRLWVADTYEARVAQGEAPEMLDKENVRRYLMDQGFKGEGTVPKVPVERLVDLAMTYLKVAETLAGQPLTSGGPSAVDVTKLI